MGGRLLLIVMSEHKINLCSDSNKNHNNLSLMICYENIVDVTSLFYLSFVCCMWGSHFFTQLFFFLFIFIKILLYPNLNIYVCGDTITLFLAFRKSP